MMKSTRAVSNRKFLFFTDYSERKMVAPKLPPRSPECMKKAKNFGKETVTAWYPESFAFVAVNGGDKWFVSIKEFHFTPRFNPNKNPFYPLPPQMEFSFTTNIIPFRGET